MINRLLLIDAPHFCAAAVVEGFTVVRAAPIIAYSIGRDASWLKSYCWKKGWKIEERIYKGDKEE